MLLKEGALNFKTRGVTASALLKNHALCACAENHVLFLNKTNTVHLLAGSQCCGSGSGTLRPVHIRSGITHPVPDKNPRPDSAFREYIQSVQFI